MEVLVVSDDLRIQSHKGIYTVHFENELLRNLSPILRGEVHFLLDANVARLYDKELRSIVQHKNTILVDATETNKSIEQILPVFERLIENGVRRDHSLVAVGGGIIQDITCFIASTLLRGLKWKFVPTTLLSQADSCIGSKSSINLGKTKNILGTFNPPNEIWLSTEFLKTLDAKDVLSGIGEILKVHAIDSVSAFDQVSADYDRLRIDHELLRIYIEKSLMIKKQFIEEDEFDRGARNIFNYGHSFGHAIEAATNFEVPHGIAVTMGMDMANRIALMRGLLPEHHYLRMHSVLRKNYDPFSKVFIPRDAMLSALMKDKKNTTSKLVLIFPVGVNASIERVEVVPDEVFQRQCDQFLTEMAV
jgi:3-dehydroquinate synthase